MNGNSPVARIPQKLVDENDPYEKIKVEEMLMKMRDDIVERMSGYQVQMIIKKKLMAIDMWVDQGPYHCRRRNPSMAKRSLILARFKG